MFVLEGAAHFQCGAGGRRILNPTVCQVESETASTGGSQGNATPS